jgi:hypothetical protein
MPMLEILTKFAIFGFSVYYEKQAEEGEGKEGEI